MCLITLSMPIYNVEQYIERALLSALNQTYQNLEILIVDDLGHDNSMNIVYQLKHTHPRGNCIRIITHKKNLGLGGTRNTAIESAQGKYLYFMDSDDAIVPDCIETLYNIISQEKENELTVLGTTRFVKGKVCVFIGGGGSTEISIFDKKIIESTNTKVGVIDVMEQFPDLANEFATTSLETVKTYIRERLILPKEKADTFLFTGHAPHTGKNLQFEPVRHLRRHHPGRVPSSSVGHGAGQERCDRGENHGAPRGK